LAGHFTISTSDKEFSAISIDQVLEQLNTLIKGDGGAIDLIENAAAWLLLVIRLLPGHKIT